MKPVNKVEELVSNINQENVSVAELLCDRHDQTKTALYYENQAGKKCSYSFGELQTLSRKLAGIFQQLGVEKGDRIAVMLPKGPEMVISALAVWRLGAVYVPLFTAFGPKAISYRATHSGASIIITNEDHRFKLHHEASEIDASKTEVITVAATNEKMEKGDIHFWDSIEQHSPVQQDTVVQQDDLLVLIYTSGTTGQPKGVEVPVFALASFESYMRFGLHLKSDDVFWNIADPGWAYGLYFSVIGPLLLGQAFILYDGKFDVEETMQLMKTYQVTNFAAAPTVYRTMRAQESSGPLANLQLQTLSSAGEPLNFDVSHWANETFGTPIYDHYGQTEMGMVINNHHHPELKSTIRKNSMGSPMPGYRAVILNENGEEQPAGVEGELAIDTENSALFWFRHYYKDEEKTEDRFINQGKYYLTGDAASRDEDGVFYFSGRSDDIITSSGYKIGPFEVESALMGHEAVAETTVIGKPDEQKGEIVKAFVVLKPDHTPSEGLKEALSTFVKHTLSAHEYPREIEFLDTLPKTPSGKVQRFYLRQK
ncbi:MAG TPA: AMP-binding protein [Pseudogracilibacillus sp.]|nr:AMP-binding protein [Pseudogracilibacillus sp.]